MNDPTKSCISRSRTRWRKPVAIAALMLWCRRFPAQRARSPGWVTRCGREFSPRVLRDAPTWPSLPASFYVGEKFTSTSRSTSLLIPHWCCAWRHQLLDNAPESIVNHSIDSLSRVHPCRVRGRLAPSTIWSDCFSPDTMPFPFSNRSINVVCGCDYFRSGHPIAVVLNETPITASRSIGICGRRRPMRAILPIG